MLMKDLFIGSIKKLLPNFTFIFNIVFFDDISAINAVP